MRDVLEQIEQSTRMITTSAESWYPVIYNWPLDSAELDLILDLRSRLRTEVKEWWRSK